MQPTETVTMDDNLEKAIEKWRDPKRAAFDVELPRLYKALVEASQKDNQREYIRAFLAENSLDMDSCMRWHLLDRAIKTTGSESSTGTVNTHLHLAKEIILCDGLKENVLFFAPKGKQFKARCSLLKAETDAAKKQQQKLSMTSSATKSRSKDVDTSIVNKPAAVWINPSANTKSSSKTNVNSALNGHFGRVVKTKDLNKSLFMEALCDGYPHLGALVAEVQGLLSGCGRKPADITDIARRNMTILLDDLIGSHKKTSPALQQVLQAVPNFLQPKDGVLFDRIILDPLPQLADDILQAPGGYAALLTTEKHVVQAINNWMTDAQPQMDGPRNEQGDDDGHDDKDDKNDNDDNDDDSNESNNDNEDDNKDDLDVVVANAQWNGAKPKTERRQQLAYKLLVHAPENVLRSPEVLQSLMWHELLGESNIRAAYENNANRRDNDKFPRTKFAFAPYLLDVPGILHMAVYFQQQPLVEALLRLQPPELVTTPVPRAPPSLAVTRSFVRLNSLNSGIVPKKNEERTSSTGSTTGNNKGTSGSSGVNGGTVVNGASSLPSEKKADGGCYPLWFNNETVRVGSPYFTRTKDNRKWNQIRSALIYCTMMHAENVQTLLTILRESGEPENEINFDMSRLMIEGTSVADFVTSLPRRGRSHDLIRYEETIRYADFPVLDVSTQTQTPLEQNQQRSYRERTNREVLDMLEWLYDHGVRRIIRLHVPDRITYPHDELEIARVVRRFCVEKLDWRILDLSLSIFMPYGKPDDIPLTCRTDGENETTDIKSYLRTLNLYTGGRRSALDHWFSSEGLVSMKLENVVIYVIKELMTKKQCDETVKYIRLKIKELKDRHPEMKMQIEVQAHFWKNQAETPRLQEIIHHLSPRLAQFIAYYRQKAEELHNDKKKQFKPTKIAIIDNGILSMDPPNIHGGSGREVTDTPSDARRTKKNTKNKTGTTATSISDQHLQSEDFFNSEGLLWRICDGKSFVREPDRLSPWYLASNPHGTQMANLVCAIDPLCQLFVAKIADNHYGYSAERAAEAVRWAIKKKVDIISMSFTTTEKNKEFEEAVEAAMDDGIIIVCSHHDEGALSTKDVYPACFGISHKSTMFRMASCNMYGKLMHDWDESTTDESSQKKYQYDLCVNSQNIAVGAIPFLAKSTEHISGSSVATAIAAGVCSLFIACLRTLEGLHVDNNSGGLNTGPNHTFDKMRNNVKTALQNNNRPEYEKIKAYLRTMAPSTLNDKFISLDRFARLDELRDVNSASLSTAFINLGASLGEKT